MKMNKFELSTTKPKLIVTKKLLDKINTLNLKFISNEWSGTLFYSFEGTFLSPDFKIICHDLYLQDIGSSVYTEFQHDKTLMVYMSANDLFDYKRGLIHSHHSMSAFFSGQDTSTLKEFGQTFTHFLSLIVNNSGDYVASITFKAITNAVQSYDAPIDIPKIESLFYIELDVEKEVDVELMNRIKLLQTKIAPTPPKETKYTASSELQFEERPTKNIPAYRPTTNFSHTLSLNTITPFVFIYRLFTNDYSTPNSLIEADETVSTQRIKKADTLYTAIKDDTALQGVIEHKFCELVDKYLFELDLEEENDFYGECFEELSLFEEEKGCKRLYTIIENLLINNATYGEEETKE